MSALTARLRAEPPASVGGLAVEGSLDYAHGAPMPVVNPLPGDPAQVLPPTDMLEWRLAGGSKVLLRPSGTEPKLKCYCFAKGATEGEATALLDAIAGDVEALISETERS